MSDVTSEPDLVLPSRLMGPSLTAAGLAAWILGHAGLVQEAERTGDLQDLIDAALSRGSTDVRVPSTVVAQAADLWDRAAELAGGWAHAATSEKDEAQWQRHAERLRIRSRSLRALSDG